MKIVAGNSNRALAEEISSYLGAPLAKCQVRRFADQEIFVELQENVRGEDVFVLQSTSFPANDHLMELLIVIDALRRSSAKRITAVVPYFGYARQDRRASGRTPISAKLVANLITHAGAHRVLTLDLHAGQIQGFFDIPTDNLFAAPVMTRDIKERYSTDNVMVVSPDVGGVVRARALAKRIDAPLAIVDKRRDKPGESEVMNIIGDPSAATASWSTTSSIPAAPCAMPPRRCWPRVPSRSPPTSPTACCPVARWPASPRPSSRNWSSPIPSSRPQQSSPRRTSAPSLSPR